MELPNVEELGKIIDLCRKKGVKIFELPNKLRLELGEAPVKVTAKTRQEEKQTPDPMDPWSEFPTGELDPEELMFFSSGGKMEDFAEFQRQRGKKA